MLSLIVSFSRYVVAVLVVLYTLLNFYYYLKKTDRGRNGVVSVQYFLMYVLHFFLSMILFFSEGQVQILIFYVCTFAVMFIYEQVYPAIYRRADRHLVCNVLFLVMIGLTMQMRLKQVKAVKQLILLALAMLVTLVVPKILDNGRRYLYRFTWVYGIGGLAFITAIVICGQTEYGAKLSFGFNGFSLQPSEFVKITMVFFVAGMFQRSTKFKQVFITTLVAAAHVLVLVISKDLGTALIYFFAYVFMLFVATENFIYLFAGLFSGAGAAVVAYKLFAHIQTRVAIWRDPWADPYGSGLQIVQSLYGISTGRLLGMGLTGGTPGVVPVAEKDFIFSGICEELGILTGICLLLIFMGILLRFLYVATWMSTMFYKITAFGLAMTFGVQILVNVAGVIKLIPLTGITLPFVSYGGSSLLSTFFVFGIFEGLYMNKLREDEALKREKNELAARELARKNAVHKAQEQLEGW